MKKSIKEKSIKEKSEMLTHKNKCVYDIIY